jgi:hypothetical protein
MAYRNEEDFEVNEEQDDMKNELDFIRSRYNSGEKVDPDELLMIGIIED